MFFIKFITLIICIIVTPVHFFNTFIYFLYFFTKLFPICLFIAAYSEKAVGSYPKDSGKRYYLRNVRHCVIALPL